MTYTTHERAHDPVTTLVFRMELPSAGRTGSLPRRITARLVVLERQPYWAPLLRGPLAAAHVEVVACDRVDRLEALLQDCETPVVLYDATEPLPGLLTWLGARAAQERSPRLLVRGGPIEPELEWALRGLGALSLTSRDEPVDEVAGWCLRALEVTTPLVGCQQRILS